MTLRKFKIVLYGATGFTGGLAAEYLAANSGLSPSEWALAGRNMDKLKAVRDKLAASDPRWKALELLAADSGKEEDMAAMARSASIVMTTVGPYALHGEPLVKACAENGTHYLDITGEPAFVTDMLEKYDSEARKNSALIINCCGFDSIPADLGCYYTAKQFNGTEPLTVKAFVTSKGTFSGGTLASALNAMSEGIKTEKGKSSSEKGRINTSIHYDKSAGKWAVPMPVIDPWMVKRSAQMLPEIYGSDFVYGHYLGLSSLPAVAGVIGGVGMVYAGAQFKPIRSLMMKWRPSGEGPSEEQRAKGFFKLTFYASSPTSKVKAWIQGGDPGYTETSKMISESALTILHHYDQLKVKGGVLTPAGALGDHLLNRLQAAGIVFGAEVG